MPDEISHGTDGDGGGGNGAITVEQQKLKDVTVEICTTGESLIAVSRVLWGAARDSDRAELLRIKATSAKLRGTLVDLETLLDDLVG